MGHFYTNITLVGVGSQDIAAPIREFEWHAYISPKIDGNVIIFDECNLMDGLEASASVWSNEFKCPAWAVMNYDDDILFFWLYENMECTAKYNSSPNYFNKHFESDAPRIENLDALLRVFNASAAREKIAEVLSFDNHPEEAERRYVWEVERHAELLKLLKLPPMAAGCGLNYMNDGECPEGFSLSDFTKTW